MSWGLRRLMLSMFGEASSTTARLQLPTLPVMGGLRDTTKDKKVCIYTNSWALYVI